MTAFATTGLGEGGGIPARDPHAAADGGVSGATAP